MILAGLTAALNDVHGATVARASSPLSNPTGVAVYVMWHLIPLERGVRQRVAFTLIWVAATALWVLSRSELGPLSAPSPGRAPPPLARVGRGERSAVRRHQRPATASA